ncbi:MAG: TatD family hydrolase [Alphaproteobacteria bacterium]|nr:TatD family hydrolase [Alphaproteobacteria bacterium]MCL2505955.1 TatD family hydrolase [Alphaproteobacteria bacterium]
MIIDSHCHLEFPGLVENKAEVIARAKSAGVSIMLNVSTKKQLMEQVIGTADEYKEVYASAGIHPHHSAEEGGDISVAELLEYSKHPKVIAIGESGLDYFYDYSPKETQIQNFRKHIRAAQQADLPLLIHSRDAEEDTIRVLKEEGGCRGILHCFSSKRVLAEKGLEMGLYVSCSGIISFKKSEELREIIKDVPLERLLVETDAPFLAPDPYRGKVCEPAFVAETLKVLADVKGVDREEMEKVIEGNFSSLFF